MWKDKTKLEKDAGSLTNYLIKVGFYNFLEKMAEQKQKHPDKLKKNVIDLLNLAEKFDSMDEFYD